MIIQETKLMKKDLSNADLVGANLIGVDLIGVDLTNADLTSADLRSANLRKVNLCSADLYNANLTSANLRYVNLSNADLRYADLSTANLRYAKLDNTNVEGITMHWYSHDLISYRLRLVAETTEQELITSHIIDNRNICWGDQIKKLNKLGYATEVEWTLDVMVDWIKPNDKLPDVLKTRCKL